MNEAELRLRVVAAARWACRDSHTQLPITDSRYREVTQGRHDYYKKVGVFFSSCGELGHFVRWAVGIRRLVNRAEGAPPVARADSTLSGWRWMGAENVVWLCRPKNPHATGMRPGERCKPGTIIVVDDGVDDPRLKNHNRTHVIVVLEDKGSTIITAEYGRPGGALDEHVVAERGGFRWVAERRIFSYLDPWIEYQQDATRAEPADLDGAPQAPLPEADEFPAVLSVEKPYVSGERALALQKALQALGYDVGQVDGVAGVKTTQALVAFACKRLLA
jgi:hypothetical protein